jgi:pimeloyl-ACP methyl ester carboxylesterase
MVNTIHNDLLGTETLFLDTGNYRTRVITSKNDNIPLILLHGGGGHAEAYSRTIAPLSDAAWTIAPDFIWHGMSSKPDYWPDDSKADRHWLNQFTDQILELMDHLKIERAVIEGESLGGWIAMDMGVNHPDRVAGLVLNTSWGMALDPEKVHEGAADLDALRETSVNALRNLRKEDIRKRMDWLMPLGGVTDELVETRFRLWSQPDTRDALLEYYDRLFRPHIRDYYFTEEDLARIQARTLVLWTDSNPIHGVDAGERMAEVIPDADLVVMKGCAHWPQWEKPKEHDDAVRKFIRTL